MRRANYDHAVEAARDWISEHGRFPQQQEWERRAPGRLTTRTIKRHWSWEAYPAETARAVLAQVPRREGGLGRRGWA